MDYQLIVFDMDGTLLRSDKTVSPAVLSAVREAVCAGKSVALGTGRPVTELFPYKTEFADFRYAVLESGALVYDLQEKTILLRRVLDPACIPAMLEAIPQEDIMPQAMCGGVSYINADDLPRMKHYYMGVYETLYETSATRVPDIRVFLREHADQIEKINLYHSTVEGRERTNTRLAGQHVERIYAETTSLEISPPGINKGSGLQDLCALLGIDASEAIAVGDADNDIPMLRAAGLGIAMGNANGHVLAAADVVVSDNDHDGCAEAIREYLLR